MIVDRQNLRRLGQNLRRVRGRMSQTELGRAAGITHASVSRIEHAVSEPGACTLGRLAAVLGVSSDYLLGLTEDPAPAAERPAALQADAASDAGQALPFRPLHDLGRTAALAHPGAARGGEEGGELGAARQVEVRELAAAAGGGAMDLDETIRGYIAFQRAWLDRHALDPTQCTVIGVRGDSMEPTLPEGCAILVDRNRKRRLDDHIFVVRSDDGVIVKRAGKDPRGRWLLLSDNPAWQPVLWPDEAEVIGEVKWMALTL